MVSGGLKSSLMNGSLSEHVGCRSKGDPTVDGGGLVTLSASQSTALHDNLYPAIPRGKIVISGDVVYRVGILSGKRKRGRLRNTWRRDLEADVKKLATPGGWLRTGVPMLQKGRRMLWLIVWGVVVYPIGQIGVNLHQSPSIGRTIPLQKLHQLSGKTAKTHGS